MKKIVILMLCVFTLAGHASKFSHFMQKQQQRAQAEEAQRQQQQAQREAEQRAANEQQLRQDMEFGDLDFKLVKRYVAENNEKCRVYRFRGHQNPYKNGKYTVCAP